MRKILKSFSGFSMRTKRSPLLVFGSSVPERHWSHVLYSINETGTEVRMSKSSDSRTYIRATKWSES